MVNRNPPNKNHFNIDGTLTCRVCQVDKAVDCFHRNKMISTGYERVCKPCAKEKAALWRESHTQSRNKTVNWAENEQRKRVKRLYAQKLVDSNLVSGWRKALIDFYGGKCLKCFSNKRIEADHVVPLSRGGTHRIENFQTLCKFCNISKHAKTVDYRNGNIFTEAKMKEALTQK